MCFESSEFRLARRLEERADSLTKEIFLMCELSRADATPTINDEYTFLEVG